MPSRCCSSSCGRRAINRSMRATVAELRTLGSYIGSGGEVGGCHDGTRRALERARREAEADAVEARAEDDRAVRRRAHPLLDDAGGRNRPAPPPRAVFARGGGPEGAG